MLFLRSAFKSQYLLIDIIAESGIALKEHILWQGCILAAQEREIVFHVLFSCKSTVEINWKNIQWLTGS